MRAPAGAEPATAAAGQSRTPAAAERTLEIVPVRGIYGHLLEGPFLQPTGVAHDPFQDEILICDAGGHRIAIADARGVPIFSFGSAATLDTPRHAVATRDGRILVADAAHDGVRVFDYDGQPLPDLDLSSAPPGEKQLRPVALALSHEGTLYVLDGSNRRVVVATSGGGPARALRAPSGRPDLLVSPIDLDLTPEGSLAVADVRGLAVQVYDPSGKLLLGFGEHEIGMDGFSQPSGIAVDEKGRFFVSDTLRQDVKVFSPEGTFLTSFGGPGTHPGEFLYPIDVASDRDGRILVTERVGRRVQVFQVTERPAATRERLARP